MLKDNQIDMALIQETKRANISIEMVKSIWHKEEVDFVWVDADGNAGGLLCV